MTSPSLTTDDPEHPVTQPIECVDVYQGTEGDVLFYKVGRGGITRIEACTKSGMHANIPYVRVWKGDEAIAEFCQHNVIGVYFAEPEP